ncbi:MAG: alcohol dehydrogenase catalytic domain-containing protein, partial [Candidatus Acidiferrales bacterium]
MNTAVSIGQMTAAVLRGREDVRVERVEIPDIGADEALVRVKVALTCGTDLKVWRQGYHERMIKPPALFGHEWAGVVERVGPDAPGWVRPGLRVTAGNSAPCGACFYCLRGQQNLCEDLVFNNGAYAEYVRVPGRIVRENLLEIPEHVSFRDAALIEPLACVLRGIEETGVRPGDTVALIGCGPLGLMFIRLFSQRGVGVLAVAKHASQAETAHRLGATVAFTSSKMTDPVDEVRRKTSGRRGADAVIEAVGTAVTWEWAVQMVRRGGTVNLFGGCPRGSKIELDPTALHYSEITIKSSFHHTPQYVREALDTIARGEISADDFVNRETPLADLPKLFARMKDRKGEMKVAI